MSDPREHVIGAFQNHFLKECASDVDISATTRILDVYQLFGQNNSSNQGCINLVNKYLSSSSQRLEGLVLLNQIILQSTTELYTTNVMKWLPILINILQGYNTKPVFCMCCKVIQSILEYVSSFPELYRDVSTSLVPQIISALLNTGPENIQPATQCLSICMKTFPGACSSSMDKLNRFIENQLFSPSFVSDETLRCYVLMCQCGGKGSEGVKYVELWSSLCAKLHGRIAGLLNLLFEDIETDKKMSEDNIQFESNDFSDLPTSNPERFMQLTHHLETFTRCLQLLLKEDFPVSVKVPVEDLLHIICRALAVHGSSLLLRPVTDRILLASLLPMIHQASLDLLGSVILCCKKNLVMFSSVVNKLFLETLSWTHTQDTMYGHTKPLAALRTSVYKVMVLWLQVLGASSDLVFIEKDVLMEIMSDVHSPVDEIKLETKSPAMNSSLGPPAKKKRKSGYQEITHGISTQRKIDSMCNQELVLSGLKALRCFVSMCGVLMKSTSIRDVYEFVLTTLLNIHESPHMPPIPYSSIECRRELYKLLTTCVICCHPSTPSVLQCATSLFRIGCQDSSSKVSSFCRQSLNICECIIHPRAPSLRGPTTCTLDLHIQTHSDSQDLEQHQNTDSKPNSSHGHTSLAPYSQTVSRVLDKVYSSHRSETANSDLSSQNHLNTGVKDTDVSKAMSYDGDSIMKEAEPSSNSDPVNISHKEDDNVDEEEEEEEDEVETENGVLEISDDSVEIVSCSSDNASVKLMDTRQVQSKEDSSLKGRVEIELGECSGENIKINDGKLTIKETTDNGKEDHNASLDITATEENSHLEEMLSCFVDAEPDSD